MSTRTRWFLSAVACVTAWLLLAPSQIGGPVTYVSTYGISMEPGIQAGDLVLARPQSSYDIGNSVAYHSDVIHETVLHRIVAEDADGRFTTKGDNNDWLDPDHPRAGDISGAQWVRIPQGGVWLRRLANPIVIAGLLAILLWFGSATGPIRRQRGRQRRAAMGSAP